MTPGGPPQRLGPFGRHGATVHVVTDHDEVASIVAAALAPLRTDGPADEGGAVEMRVDLDEHDAATIAVDGVPKAYATRGRLLEHLLQQVNQHVLTHACSDDDVLFHAGAVARDGYAVVLPADQEAGKSTLTGALLDDGWAYLSDEGPAVTADLDVLAYPKPLSLDQGSWPLFPHRVPDDPAWHAAQWQVVPEQVVETARIAALVFPQYAPGTAGGLHRLTPGEVVEWLVPCTFVLHREFMATTTVRRLAAIAEAVPGFTLEVDDLDSAVAAVAEAHAIGVAERG